MKKYFLVSFFLSLAFTQCTSQSKNNKTNTPEISITLKNYKNKVWPQLTGPSMDGKVESEFVPDETTAVSWQFEYEGGESTPLVVSKGTVFFGTASKEVYAIDSLGKVKWKIKMNSKISHSPAIHDNVLIVAPDSTLVYGINAQNGEIIWERDFPYEYKSYVEEEDPMGFPIVKDTSKYEIKRLGMNETAPLVYKDEVYLSIFNHIIVANAQTGKTNYYFAKQQGKTSIPLITENAIYFESFRNFISAYDKEKDTVIWESKKIYDLSDNKPFLYKDTLYTYNRSSLQKLDAKSGKKIGSVHFSHSWKNYDVVDDNIYYLAENGYHTHMGTNFGSYVSAFDLNTEEEIWDYNMEAKAVSELILVGDYVYFGDSSGRIRGLDKNSGHRKLKIFIGGDISHPLSYANGTLYGASEKNGKNIIFAVK